VACREIILDYSENYRQHTNKLVVKTYNPYTVREARGVAKFFGTWGEKIIMIAPNRSYEL
jgi:hypothetical protein